MNTGEHSELFRFLMQKVCLPEEEIVFVDNIADWCREHGIAESDGEKPFKIIAGEEAGCKMLVRENVSDKAINERIAAVSIRNQIRSVATDKTEALDTVHKKLAFLLLREYATALPDVGIDELLADEWTFEQMERLGYFQDRPLEK